MASSPEGQRPGPGERRRKATPGSHHPRNRRRGIKAELLQLIPGRETGTGFQALLWGPVWDTIVPLPPGRFFGDAMERQILTVWRNSYGSTFNHMDAVVNPFRRFVLYKLGILVLAVLVLPVPAYSGLPSGTPDRVRLQLKWFHQFQFAGYYAAKEKGVYAAAGLDVEILEGGPTVNVLADVTGGKAEFGVLGAELAYHRIQGKDVVALAPILQHSIRTIIARADRGIASPHDLPGKTLMLNKSELPEFAAMFLNEGMGMNRLTVLAKDRTANGKFIRGDIDAMNGSIANQPFLFSRENVPYNLIRPINYGIDFYGDTLFTTSELLRKNPEMVDRFLKASLEGWRYAFDNPGEMVDLILAAYSRKKTRAHLMFEQERLRGLSHPDLVEIGHNNPQRWAHVLKTYKRLGLVPETADLDGFVYQDYLDGDGWWVKWLLWGLVLGAVLFCVGAFWNMRLRQAVRKMTRTITESGERIRITLDAIGDAVIATDGTGRIERMNPVAEKLTGWRLEEARGKLLEEVFRIINVKTGLTAENPVKKVLEEGHIVGLANHTALLSKDGSRHQIADSGAPIFDENNKISGVVLVFRDMTEEYAAQERIRENEQKFRSYMHNAPYGIFVLDREGRILEVNQAMGRILGSDPGSLPGRSVGDLFPGQEGEGQLSASRALDAGRSHGILSLDVKDRDTKICEVDMVRLSRDRVLGFANDITRRRAVEARAIELAKFPSENPNPVLRVDPDGVILYANRGSRLLLGSWQTAIGGNVPPVWKERVADTILKQRPVLFEENAGSVCLSLVVTPVEPQGFANIYGMDITEQHRTRDLLKKSEEKYRELVEGSDDLIISVKASGVVRFVNRIAGKYLGVSPEEAQGISLFSFVHREDRQATKTWFDGCVSGGLAAGTYENRLVSMKTGEVFHVLWTCNFHYDRSGRLKMVNAVARNITDRKQLEAEKQAAEDHLKQALKMEAVGNIAGGIAHDFNNIMGIIIGNVELAMEAVPQWNPARQNLDEIRVAGLRASEVVKQLLSFSRKSDHYKKVMTLQPIIKESVSLLRASIPTSIEIRLDIDRETGPIEADPTQIHQILINLCTNAAHAMDAQGGILSIRLGEKDLDAEGAAGFDHLPPGRYARLTISDTGQGIDPDIVSKIFDPYFTTKKVGKGTGMGLAVVHGIVKSTGGGIRVDSEPGRGSAFHLLFPLTRARVQPEEEEENLTPTGSGRILLVDDEASLLKLGRRQLESLGYRVEIRQDPLDALSAIASDPSGFDLVITDMTMPRMTGDQLVEKVLEIRPDLPVVLCTGYSSKINRERSRDLGVSGYVEKPFNRNQLALAVADALRGTP